MTNEQRECPGCYHIDWEVVEDDGDDYLAICQVCGFEATNRSQVEAAEEDA